MTSKASKTARNRVKRHSVSVPESKNRILDSQKRPPLVLIIAFVFIILIIFIYYNNRNVKDSNISLEEQEQVEATLESKLKEIYEKRTGTDLGKDFSPRFSVFEDSLLGFRLAYPVGFKATSTNNGVQIISELGGGSVIVLVNNGSFEVKTNKDGLSEKQAEIIDSSSVFIRDSFQFIDPQNSQDLKERFSEGPGKDRY